jgi:hypothetical protein
MSSVSLVGNASMLRKLTIVAIALLTMFVRSAIRVLATARKGIAASGSPVRG